MIFEIDFNRETNDKLLEIIGAKLVKLDSAIEEPPFEVYKVEVDEFEDLEKLIAKVDKYTGRMYSAIISFDPPTIFLDSEV